jgi:tetratricopeptide (TPR) repeat protein
VPKVSTLIALLVFGIGLCSAAAGRATPGLVIEAESQYHFALHLSQTGDYDAAASEFKRFVHFFPEDPRVPDAMAQIGIAQFKAKRFKEAIGSFQAVIDRFPGTPLAGRAYLHMAQCYVQLDDTGMALTTLHNLVAVSADTGIRGQAWYRIGWIYVEMGQWEDARRALAQIDPKDGEKYRLQPLLQGLNRAEKLPLKNPRLAGLLSVVPGGGQLYCNRYQDAVVAFLLNGALIAAAWQSFDHDLSALGAVISCVEFGFYAGNIYGAIGSAHKYNRCRIQLFIDDLRESTRLRVSALPKHPGLVLSLDYRF